MRAPSGALARFADGGCYVGSGGAAVVADLAVVEVGESAEHGVSSSVIRPDSTLARDLAAQRRAARRSASSASSVLEELEGAEAQATVARAEAVRALAHAKSVAPWVMQALKGLAGLAHVAASAGGSGVALPEASL